jgi:hypothetical protein
VRWHGAPPTHVSLAALSALGVRHAFTTRHHGSVPGLSVPGGPFPAGGAGPALETLGIEGGTVRYARQVHGAACLVADAAPAGLVGTADALITTRRGHPLAVFTADCLPVVLVDPARPALALAHAGWRGVVRGILGEVVSLLVTRGGAEPGRLVAAIGPSIGPCCYEVDAPVVEPLEAAFPGAVARWTRPHGPGKWWLDLWRAAADQLVAAGLRPEAILSPRLCTGCRRDVFFSYRKEGPGLRLATLAVLE